jgi:hypothetical protein
MTGIKRIPLALILLTAFQSVLFAQKKLTEVDLRISGVGSGASYPAVLSKLGRPRSKKSEQTPRELSCTASDITELTLQYPGLEIGLLGDGDGQNLNVVEIVVTSHRWQASGIRVGDTTKVVFRRFGKPNSRANRGNRVVYYYVTPGNLGGVNFEFLKDRLVKIVMSETLC